MNRPAHLRTATPEFRFRTKLIAPVVGCGLMLFLAGFAQAESATWKRNPRSGDWNTKTNWRPATVPNEGADIATFAFSNTTDISISALTEVDGITFAPGASAFTIVANPPGPDVTSILLLSGVGITNNSGITQSFATGTTRIVPGEILFTHSATAGTSTNFSLNSGFLYFKDTATA